MAVTGKGAASKEQVAGMLKRIMVVDEKAESLDATDALAVAVCHAYQMVLPGKPAAGGSWEAFVSKNPQRIVRK